MKTIEQIQREIKFRAKRLDNNEFVIGYYLPMVDGSRHFIYLPLDYLNEHSRIEIDPKTLGQWTGLKDENGKEIYEGDIIKHSYDDERFIVPNFTPISRLYEAESINPHHYGNDDWMSFSELDWEVIGNIYKNPELLKGGE